MIRARFSITLDILNFPLSRPVNREAQTGHE